IKKDINAIGSDIEIVIRNFVSIPTSSFFSEYYEVKAYVDIKIKNKDYLSQVFDLIKGHEDAKVTYVDFKFMDYDGIKNDLMKNIAFLAESRQKAYENNFNIKLKYLSITEADLFNRSNIGRGYYSTIGSANPLSPQSRGGWFGNDNNSFTLNPVRIFSFTVIMKYEIIDH
ncbi:hypothetical protein ACFLSQ_07455, partial [Bacteroidota bacterium]